MGAKGSKSKRSTPVVIDRPPPSNAALVSSNVGVIGGGAWGTALAIHAARAGHNTLVYAREPEVVEAINKDRENTVFLKGHKVPELLHATGDAEDMMKRSSLLLMVVPTPFVKATMSGLAKYLRDDHMIVCCSKGIHTESLETVDELMHHALPKNRHMQLAFLSGPSFAADVAQGRYTAVTVASEDEKMARKIQALLSTPLFRCFTSTDVPGVELGGALKNVLAIACGICDGLEFGHNARAALITRGLAEIIRLAVAKGANPLTLGGLAGMGDLVLTCTGDLSRNRTVGMRLGKGESLEQILKTSAVAEGVLTSRAAKDLASKLKIECPIIEAIYRVIHEGASPQDEVHKVMTRELTAELDHDVLEAAAGESMKGVRSAK